MYELQRLSAQVRDAESGERKAIAAVLAGAFGTLAQQADGMPVTADAARNAFVTLDQPVKDCLALLVGNVPGLDATTVIGKLQTAASQVKLA